MKKIMAEVIAHFNKITPLMINNVNEYEISPEKRIAGLIIVKYAINYLTIKRSKKNFIIIKNFIKSSHIITRKNHFLKLKDVRLLWNTLNNTSLKEVDISNHLSSIFGNIVMNNGLLGWRNKTINEIDYFKENTDIKKKTMQF